MNVCNLVIDVTKSRDARKFFYSPMSFKNTSYEAVDHSQRYNSHSSFHLLQDEGLIKAYYQACELQLDQKFIALLREEMFIRNLKEQ